MEKDIKKIRLTSPAWEYQRVADICNEQSEKGFQLDKISVFGRSTFKKDESKRYAYVIDYNVVVLKNNEEKEKYLEMFTEQGWEFVDNTFNGFSIFRKEFKEGIAEDEYKIYTDQESSKELCLRISKLLKFALVMFAISCALIITGFAILIFFSETEAEKMQAIHFGAVFMSVIAVCLLPIILFFKSGLKKLEDK